MLRQLPSTQLRRNLSLLALFGCVTFFLIGSNTIYLQRHQFCIHSAHFTGGSGSGNDDGHFPGGLTLNLGNAAAESQQTSAPATATAAESNSYIFVKEKSLIMSLTANSNTSKATIDLLVLIRKLAIFAAHELNAFVGCDNSCVVKWWANPVNTLALKSRHFPVRQYVDHDLTFVAEPDALPCFVRIRQFNMTLALSSKRSELKILGKFLRLDGGEMTKAKWSPSVGNLNSTSNTSTISDAAAVAEEAADPELFSWPRNKSFLVGDYMDFKDKGWYHINPGGAAKIERYCGSALKMLIMVSSAPGHFEQRRAIRETYGSEENLKDKAVRLVFLFGKVTNDSLQALLEEEAKVHEDIIQAGFMDSYHNLTLSHLSMYNWVQQTCEDHGGLPKYVLKADDDFFLNIDLALRVAYGNPNYELMGVAYCGTRPVRSLAYVTKYYTPRYMYMADMYVGYLSGVAYIFRTDIIPRVLQMSLTTPIIHMDDVYMTGLVARQLNIPPMGSPLFTYGRSLLDPCSVKKMVSSYVLWVDDMRAQWKEFLKPIPSNCSLTSVNDLIKINPFRPQDLVGCILQ